MVLRATITQRAVKTVEAPCPKRAVLFQRHTVRKSDADLRPVLVGSDAGGDGAMPGQIRLAQLTVLIVTPAPQAAIALERQRVIFATGNLRPIRIRSDASWKLRQCRLRQQIGEGFMSAAPR